MRDLHFGLRQLIRSPLFTFAAVVSLAFGIGANTAIFSLLDALLFRPLPVYVPQQLVRIGTEASNGFIDAIPGGMLDWLRKNPLLNGVCGAQTPLTTIELNNQSMPAGANAVSGDCYRTLGVHAELGRTFTLADDIPNGPRVAMLSHSFWQEKFAGNPRVLGQNIRIEGVPFSIIGVTEPRFEGLLLGYPPMVSFPISQEINAMQGDTHPAQVFYWAFAFARLKPGVTAEQVRAELAVAWRRNLEQTLPASIKGREREVMLRQPPALASGATGLDYTMRNRYRQALVGLLAISGLVLLTACLNVANLLLARGLQRRGEIAVRLALGAARWRIIRQLAVESFLLLLGGIAVAALFSYLLDRLLLAMLSQSSSGFSITVAPDVRVLLFTAGIALVALLAFAVLPVWQASRLDLANDLKSASRSTAGGHSGSRRLLLALQVAFALVLVTGASLFVETLRQLHHQSLGFGTEAVLNGQLMPLPGGYAKGFAGPVYYRALLDRMRALPGVASVSLSSFSPLFTTPWNQEIRATDRADQTPVESPAELVSDGFFAAMRIPLLAGSNFGRDDSAEEQHKAVISRSLAERLFPHGGALGKHISAGTGPTTADVEIIGIAANARLMDPRSRDTNFVYLDFWQQPKREGWGNLQVRYSGNTGLLTTAMRTALHEAGHEYTLHLRTISEQRDLALLREKLLATLGTAFGVLALILAAVGLFGLLAFFVTSRTNEIGIRMALGANRNSVSALVIREAFLLVGTGIAMGLPLSYLSGRALSGLLYGVSSLPAASMTASIALLLLTAGLAAYFPARRAMAIDPMAALRHE